MMNGEERDRLAKAEQAIVDMREDISAIRKDTSTAYVKALNMSRGGFWVALRFGGLLVLISGAIAWLIESMR
jgi:hypothetical protein